MTVVNIRIEQLLSLACNGRENGFTKALRPCLQDGRERPNMLYLLATVHTSTTTAKAAEFNCQPSSSLRILDSETTDGPDPRPAQFS